LRSSRRDAIDRHATLRAAIEWSWEMLSDDERAALADCAIFAGGFELEAFAQIVEGGGVEILQTLHHKSLIAIDRNPANEQTRFRLLESIRLFAAEQLETRGERAAVEQRHATYYAARACEWASQIPGPSQLGALANFELELPNLLAAQQAATARGPADRCVRLARALAMYLGRRGPQSLAISLLELALTRTDLAPAERGQLLSSQIATRLLAGHHPTIGSEVEQLLALAWSIGDHRLELSARRYAGWIELDYPSAKKHLDAGLALAKTLGEPVLEGRAHEILGAYFGRRGEYDEAAVELERSISVSHQIGDTRVEG
jgi:hypothetical protein